jgi:hypothetical protein
MRDWKRTMMSKDKSEHTELWEERRGEEWSGEERETVRARQTWL